MSMSPAYQPIHILRKDAIHLWPETLVSIALLGAYAWAETQTWLPSNGEFNPAILAVGFLRFLIPVTWLVLISRLVHDEELVGDRQFWITRPYTWYSLLLSKILYIAVFLCIPFLIMQAWLLHHAGLYPTPLIPPMLKNLLYVLAIFILPLFAIAAVTSTFVRYISSALVGLIYFFIISAVAAHFWGEKLSAPTLGYYIYFTLLALIVAAVLLAYWRRKILIARVLIVGLPLVVLIFAFLAPVNLLTAHRYPQTTAGTLSFENAAEFQQPSGRLFTMANKVILNLPVQVQLTGLPDHSSVEVQYIRATIDGPSGYHYTTNWSPAHAELHSQVPFSMLTLSLPEAVYGRIHNQPVALHLQLGTQVFNDGTPYSVDTAETAFPLPGHAACTVSSDDGVLECRFAFANRQLKRVEANVTNGNCMTPGALTARGFGFITPDATPVYFSPVEINHTQLKIRNTNVSLCPGARITVTPSVEGAYGRMSLDIPTITLDSYAVHIPTKTSAPQPPPQPEPQP